jgi:hypothetical protein
MQQGRLTVRDLRLCDQVTGAERVWAALTLWYGIATSLQCRQFGWFTAFLASGCLGLVGLVYTILLFVSDARRDTAGGSHHGRAIPPWVWG